MLYQLDRIPETRMAYFQELVAKARAEDLEGLRPQGTRLEMWDAADRATARETFDAWYSGAIRSGLEPIKRVAGMLKRHLDGVLNAIVSRATNARIEGINTVTQSLKRSARGFRSRERFRTAIYFHLGGLDLHPASLTHTDS